MKDMLIFIDMATERTEFKFFHSEDPNRDLIEVVNWIESRSGVMMTLTATIASLGIFLGQSRLIIPAVIYLLLSLHAFFRVFSQNPTQVIFDCSRYEVVERIRQGVLNEQKVIEYDNSYRARLVKAYDRKSDWMHKGYGLLLCFFVVSILSRITEVLVKTTLVDSFTRWMLVFAITLAGVPAYRFWRRKKVFAGSSISMAGIE